VREGASRIRRHARELGRLLVGTTAIQRTSAALQWIGLAGLVLDWRFGVASSSDAGFWVYATAALALCIGIVLIFAADGAGPIVAVAGLLGLLGTAAFLGLISVPSQLQRFLRRRFGRDRS
jgi:hypothetical protein